MVKKLVSVICLFFLLFPLSAQHWKLKRIETSLGIGTTNVYSDLGGAPNASSILFLKDISFRSTRPSLVGAIRYRVNEHNSVKVTLAYGFSKTEDYAGSRNENRGFSSVTQLMEFGGNYEYYFLPEYRRLRSAAVFNRHGMINDYSSMGAYAFIGLGATLFWPKLNLPEKRPTDTYKDGMGITPVIPVGLGLKFIISDKWIFGYDIGYRISFSDFLDGVKTASSKNPDSYWISSFNLIYRVPTSRRGLPIFMDREWKRARF
jgi:OmpA-OmpF porin, OOP family